MKKIIVKRDDSKEPTFVSIQYIDESKSIDRLFDVDVDENDGMMRLIENMKDRNVL